MTTKTDLDNAKETLAAAISARDALDVSTATDSEISSASVSVQRAQIRVSQLQAEYDEKLKGKNTALLAVDGLISTSIQAKQAELAAYQSKLSQVRSQMEQIEIDSVPTDIQKWFDEKISA